jgi:2'-5' RNA ligase
MRLFLALELPEEERRRLAELPRRRDWFGFGEGLKRVRPENLHVTLKFLGEVGETQVKHVCDALQQVTVAEPIELRTEGVTFFPPRGPVRVFVALLGGSLDRVIGLHSRVETALEPLGFARDGRPFTPHVTVARAERERRIHPVVRRLVAKNPPAPGKPFTVDAFVLFQSHLKPGGSEYIPLARFGGR